MKNLYKNEQSGRSMVEMLGVLAMAGAIWGAARGRQALPTARLRQLEAAEHIEATARQLAALRRSDDRGHRNGPESLSCSSDQ